MNGQLSGSSRMPATPSSAIQPRNVGWDVGSMLGSLADVAREPNGNLKVTRNEQALVLYASLNKDLS